MIAAEARDFLAGEGDVLAFVGGTGVSKTDVTVEAVRPLFEKELEGFGELLRSSSYERIGAAAMLSRATAGVAKGKVILCIPGSPDAVEQAFEVFGTELPHVLSVARR
jgi:molybdenum cofactor biosynthesis protein B